MLCLENSEEGVSESCLGALALSWNRNGFVRARRSLVLDDILEVVIVDVVCGGGGLAQGLHACVNMTSTHNGPILGSTSGAEYHRISYQRVRVGERRGSIN